MADIATTGSIDPNYDSTDPWVIDDILTVGVTGDANMVVSGGSQIVSDRGILAAVAASHASVQVSGAGSRWENLGLFHVGVEGDGTLTISDGAGLKVRHMVLGDNAGSVGTLLLTGPATIWEGAADTGILPWADPQEPAAQNRIFAIIGSHGTGNVTIADGARVTADNGPVYLGGYAEGVGNLTVTGPNSVWDQTGTIYVGASGTGRLEISDGGTIVSMDDAFIGHTADTSVGRVVVTDPDSLWQIGGGLYVGGEGLGELLIYDGGRVENEYAYIDSTHTGSPDYSCADVNGPGAVWQNEGDLIVGESGRGHLYIRDGGQVTDANVYVGRQAAAEGIVYVADANSLWANSGELHVGYAGEGGVSVADGGRVTSGAGVIGTEATGYGTVNITGPDAHWENAGSLEIARAGTGSLSIGTSGHVATANAVVAVEPNSTGIISLNMGGTLDVQGDLVVGAQGDASMFVSLGGQVFSQSAVMAQQTGSTAFVSIRDANSLWHISGGLHVGEYGYGELLVSDGGCVESGYADVNSPISAAEPSHAMVTGAGSLWQNEGDLIVADGGSGSLTVRDGGRITDANAYVGKEAGSEGLAYVGDSNSVWASSGELHIGYAGQGLLTLTDAGKVTSSEGVLGTESTGAGIVGVSGIGTQWENTGTLEIARAGEAYLAINNGGTVVTGGAIIAVESNSTGWLGVSSEGSKLEVQESLSIGEQGDASMSVWDGGQVFCHDAIIAQEAGSTGVVSICDANSLWSVSERLDIGGAGDANMVIADGGRVVSGLSTVRGTVQVTGSGSTWDGGSSLYISDGGEMTISDGGQVTGEIGGINGDSGTTSRVVVTGAGSLWANESDLYVRPDGDASLLISDGGQVTSGNNMYVEAEGDGTALVTVTGTGSRLMVGNNLIVGDTFHVPSTDGQPLAAAGTVAATDGGVVEADYISVYGDGVLTGDGTFAATEVINNGTIRPGNSIGTLTIDGNLVMDANSLLEVEIDNEGNSDKLIVTGEFTPGTGHIKPVLTELIVGTQNYTVVEANSVSWPQIALVYEYNTAFLQSSVGLALGFEPNVAVGMQVTALPFDDPSVALTNNQKSFGSAVNQLALDPNNPLPLLLQQLDTVAQARTAYNQLSGQTRAPLGAVTVAAGARPMSIVSSRMRGVSGSPSPDSGAVTPAAMKSDAFEVGTSRTSFALGNGTPYLSDQPWGVWGKWYGLYGDRETDGAEMGYQYSAYGAGFGLDYQISERWLLGVTGGYWDGDVDFASSADTTALTGTYVGFYGSYENSKWYVDSVITYASLDYDTTRYVDLLSERLEGDFGGNMFSGYLEAGFNGWHRADCLIQPLASLQVSYLDVDGYTESGGTSSLTYSSEQYESFRSGLGVKAARQLFRHSDGHAAELELRGRWLHEFGDTESSVDASFASDPAAGFRIDDGGIARDSVLLGAGFNARLSEAMRLFFDYDTELNADRTVQVFSAGLEYRW